MGEELTGRGKGEKEKEVPVFLCQAAGWTAGRGK